jgi:hypothetical protein
VRLVRDRERGERRTLLGFLVRVAACGRGAAAARVHCLQARASACHLAKPPQCLDEESTLGDVVARRQRMTAANGM